MAIASASAETRTLPNGDQVNYDGTFYDYRAADGKAMIKLWVPPHASPVRGILISGHGGGSGDSRSFARDENMQAFAARFGFGLAGLHTFPGGRIYAQGGKVFFDALDAFAAYGNNSELANVPFAVFGSSNGGATAYGFANYAPQRCLCFVSNVAAGGNPPVPTDDALKVPGIFVMGRFDPFNRAMEGVGRLATLMAGARTRGARWAMIIEDKGHEDGVAFDVYAKLLEQSIKLRYPADADPRQGPVQLNEIPEDAGWLADMSTWESGLTTIADYASYHGDKQAASWLLDKDMAYVYRGAATRLDPISVGIEEVSRVYNANTAPGTMYSVGGPIVAPGRRLNLVCDVRDLPDWRKIEFYNGAEKLGEVDAPHAPVLRLTVDRNHIVYCLTAVATTRSGAERVAAPFYFAVRDPSLDLLSDAQKSRPQYKDTIGLVGSKTAAAVPADYAPKASGTPAHILLAYGLTADQEKTFGIDPRAVSAFWHGIDDSHDHIFMDQRNNNREGSTFSAVNTRDAELLVKAAHSARGLYLYFEATDNQFLNYDPTLNSYFNTDCLSVLLDSKPSSVILDPNNAHNYLMQDWGLYLSTVQYQIAFGNDAPPLMFRFNYGDPWDMNFKFETFANARAQKGIEVRWVKLDRFHRVQEWFIPWTAIGQPGDVSAEPAVGTRLAFAPSYVDRDQGGEDPGTPKTLVWIDHTSPWSFSATQGDPPKGWGDLEIGPLLALAPLPRPTTQPAVSWVNPKLPEGPGLTHHVLNSKAMGHEVGYVVWTPLGYKTDQRYPVIYFLHGMGGNESADAAGFSAHVAQAIQQGSLPPLLCVFPNGGRSGYRGEVESMIIDELIPLIDQTWPTIARPAARAIAGFSMGGAGATRLLMTHPDLFCAAASWGGGGRAGDKALAAAAAASAPTLKQHGAALLQIKGDRDQPAGNQEFAKLLDDLGIANELIILKDTDHNLGLYYQRSAEQMMRFLGRHIQPFGAVAPRP
jgi:endo-1,4-beta-xylanase